MTASSAGGTVLIAGSTVFLMGAAIGVPRVFAEPSPQARLEMLQAKLRVWQLAQVPYALGSVLAGTGVLLLAHADSGGSPQFFLVAGTTLIAGALAWSWDAYLRAVRVREFAYGLLPAWPFVSYVLLTNVGLLLLGLGLLNAAFPVWIGWITIAADALFFLAYVKFRDLPPFVFYLLLLLVGAVVV